MNNTIALPHIISGLAKTAGTDEATATAFVSEFVTLIETALAKGEKVTIKQIGTFEPTEPITFEASAELAARVNAAFAIFEPVELPDDYSDEAEPLPTETAGETEPDDEPAAEETPADLAEDTAEAAPAADVSADTDAQEEIESTAEDNTEIAVEADDAPEAEAEYSATEPERNRRWSWLWCVLTLAIGFAAGYYVGNMSSHDGIVGKVDESAAVPADTASVMSQPKDSITNTDTIATTISKPKPAAERYDTITKSRFLTTMSRKYYGRMEYWVYIYLENADHLGHPDRIAPGTRVKIPPIEKYATAVTDSANLADAQSRAIEIYSRYQ